jgi:hypothetical protein
MNLFRWFMQFCVVKFLIALMRVLDLFQELLSRPRVVSSQRAKALKSPIDE